MRGWGLGVICSAAEIDGVAAATVGHCWRHILGLHLAPQGFLLAPLSVKAASTIFSARAALTIMVIIQATGLGVPFLVLVLAPQNTTPGVRVPLHVVSETAQQADPWRIGSTPQAPGHHSSCLALEGSGQSLPCGQRAGRRSMAAVAHMGIKHLPGACMSVDARQK